MPYSLPASHRSSTHILAPPRRRHHSRSPVFHFTPDDDPDDDRDHDPEEPDDESGPPPLNLNPNPSLRLSLDTNILPHNNVFPPAAVPFPRSSPPLDCPPVARSVSHPVLLSNGKPLKSSLKSSPSTPNISHSPRTIHQRARSAPTTPGSLTASVPKNVHFAEKDGLATVRVFNRSAKPASLSRSLSNVAADDTETETESEFSGRLATGAFPFPRIPASSPSFAPPTTYQLDHTTPGATSTVPAQNPSPYANIHLESLNFTSPESSTARRYTPPLLTGTLLVRNIAYEKLVAVRFTLDDWQTTSEVIAHHIQSLSSLPSALAPRTAGDVAGVLAVVGQSHSWDRFAFNIRLEDYAHKLHERVIWLVARFTGSAGEWWDNNSGSNYRIAFRVVPTASTNTNTTAVSHGRSLSAPAYFTSASGARHHQNKDTPRFSLSTPPPSTVFSPTATTATHHLSKLSLKNYAAPAPTQRTPYPSASTLMTHPATPLEDTTVATEASSAPLHTLLGTRESSSTVGTHHDTSKPTIIGGQPVSYFSPTSYGHAKGNATVDSGDDCSGLRRSNGARPFGGLGPGFGIGAIALHWPWGGAGAGGVGAGIEAGPDEAEVLADFWPVERSGNDGHVGDANGDGGRVRERREGGGEVSEEDSSSLPSSDDMTEAITSTSARKSVGTHTRERRSPPSANTGRSRNGRRMSPPPPLSGSFGEDPERDSVYKAFVKQWCFAQGPPPAVGASGGLVVG